jgi:NTE family protein
MPDVFAVFEGGGVKGIGHVGALAQIGWSAPSLTFRGYAGASAGAIVAALAAAGYQAAGPDPMTPAGPDSMKTILEQMDFTQLLDGLDDVPLETIQGLSSRIRPIRSSVGARVSRLTSAGGLRKLFHWNLLGREVSQLLQANPDIVKACEILWEHKGLYGTVRFRNWIDGLLKKKKELLDKNGNVTFKSLEIGTKGTVLKVVVTDVAGRQPKAYGPTLTPSEQVADAVLASMTIPLFFRPFPYGPNNYYVDGGLLSNFPAWLFDDENNQRKDDDAEPLPILGIRLVAARPNDPPDITSTGEFLKALSETLLSGGDFLQTRLIERFVGINVELPAGIGATDFNLSDQLKASLFDRGTFAAQAALDAPPNRMALGL